MKAIYTRINKAGDIKKYEQQLHTCLSHIEDDEDILFFHDIASKVAHHTPGLAALMEAARTGEISQVVVSSIDTLPRQYDVVVDVINHLQHFGITIFDAGTEREIVNDGLLAMYFAFLERMQQEHSIRTKEGIARARERRNQQSLSNQA